MIRLVIKGSRADAEGAAKRFGIHHIGFDDPGPYEGQKGSVVVGLCDDKYLEQVDEWYNADPAEGEFKPGSLLQIS